LAEVTNSLQNSIIDQIPQDVHKLNVFENWDQVVDEAQFEEHLKSLNVQGLKGKLLKNIRRHQLSLIEENDEGEIPVAAIDERKARLAQAGDQEEEASETTETSSGACKKFYESDFDRFKRIGTYFEPESPNMKINGRTEFSTSEALKYYAISMQGLHGDNHSAPPSWMDLVERMKWNAYEAVKGMDRAEARNTFVEHAVEKLEEHGFSAENPLKEKMNKAYMSCVAKKLASGKTAEEIEKESHEYAKQMELKKQSEMEAVPFDLSGMEYHNDFLTKNWAI